MLTTNAGLSFCVSICDTRILYVSLIIQISLTQNSQHECTVLSEQGTVCLENSTENNVEKKNPCISLTRFMCVSKSRQEQLAFVC